MGKSCLRFYWLDLFDDSCNVLSSQKESSMNLFHQNGSESYWTKTAILKNQTHLNKNIDTDICIIGGGIAGLTTAYLLSQSGRKVCLVETHEIGSGQSGRSTAQVTFALDKRYCDLEKIHGDKKCKAAATSHLEAIRQLDLIIKAEKIECDSEKVNGYFTASPDDLSKEPLKSLREKSYDYLNQELEVLLRFGFLDCSITDKIPLLQGVSGPAICYPDQRQINPLKYMRALSNCIKRNGGEIYGHSHISEVFGGKDAHVTLSNGNRVNCQAIIVASNTPINDLFSVHSKQSSYRTYVISFEIPKNSLHKMLFWDSHFPYHYARIVKGYTASSDLLFIGGEDHKTGQNDHPEHCYTLLENWSRKNFPNAGKIISKWSGNILETIDGLAYIGKNPNDHDNVFILTGFGGNGMTYATLGAQLIHDQIVGKPNPNEAIYDPSRLNLKLAGHFIKENANVLAQYKDYFIENHISEIEDLENNSGKVYRDGLQIIAGHRDQHGHLTLHSAICPHLGGLVRWNQAEKSWDCPCHGSRFNCYGTVLEGPAVSNLSPVHIPHLSMVGKVKNWVENENIINQLI